MAQTFTYKKWTTEEENFLVQLSRSSASIDLIAEIMKRTVISIQEKQRILADRLMARHGQPWTEEENAILLQDEMNYAEFRRLYQRGQKETDMQRYQLRIHAGMSVDDGLKERLNVDVADILEETVANEAITFEGEIDKIINALTNIKKLVTKV